MNIKISIPALAAMLLTANHSSYAAYPLNLSNSHFTRVQQQFQLVLPGHTLTTKVVGDSLQYMGQHTDENHVTHVRLQQQYQGFPVFGGYAIVHSDKTARTLQAADDAKMNGTVYNGLAAELGAPDADYVTRATLALQTFKLQYPQDAVSEEKVTPLIFINSSNQAVWAYRVSLLMQPHDRIPERPSAILEAKTLKPLLSWNDVKTARNEAVKGAGYGGNKRTRKYQYGNELPLLSISRDRRTMMCLMENTDIKVVDMGHKYNSMNEAMRFMCKNKAGQSPNTFWTGYRGDGYDVGNGAFSPSNDAYYAGDVVSRMYKEWYGVNVLSELGNPIKLILRVHYGEGYENAFWDNKQMTFGDGASMMYPLVSLGVTAHEVSHGFTEQQSNLNYFGQPGGLNESFSDMAAQAAEFYSTAKNSWTIGSEIMKEDSGYDALRYMDKPSRDGYSIDSADEYFDGLDVHYTSGVYNRLFYLLATHPGWDTRKAFQVMIKANMDYWTPYSSFTEAGCGILSATNDLGFDRDAVKSVLKDVAVDYQPCEL